jgi:hypothetical protein
MANSLQIPLGGVGRVHRHSLEQQEKFHLGSTPTPLLHRCKVMQNKKILMMAPPLFKTIWGMFYFLMKVGMS